MIYDFYADDTWLDSCDATEFSPARLLAILATRWAGVRMVARGAETVVDGDDFGTWLRNL